MLELLILFLVVQLLMQKVEMEAVLRQQLLIQVMEEEEIAGEMLVLVVLVLSLFLIKQMVQMVSLLLQLEVQ